MIQIRNIRLERYLIRLKVLGEEYQALSAKFSLQPEEFSSLFYSSKNPRNLIAVALIKGTKYSRIAQVKFVEDSL